MKKVSRLSLKLKKSEIGRRVRVLPGADPGLSIGGRGGTTRAEGASFLGGVWGHAPAETFENLNL